jgi:hypothetical protein
MAGIDLHGRIGIATGDVISGVLGRLQPRFCVFGEAMSQAAELEESGIKDAVHCSTEFLECITRNEQTHCNHSESFSAEIAFHQQSQTLQKAKCSNNRVRSNHRKGVAVVERMLQVGMLHVQQNMMLAQPTGGAEYQRGHQISPPPGGGASERGWGGRREDDLQVPDFNSLFHLSKSINASGNFWAWNHEGSSDRELRITIDRDGTLLWRCSP